MAERKKVIKDYEKVSSAYEYLQRPIDNRPVLPIRLGYQRSSLYLKKQQSFNGYMAYLEIL